MLQTSAGSSASARWELSWAVLLFGLLCTPRACLGSRLAVTGYWNGLQMPDPRGCRLQLLSVCLPACLQAFKLLNGRRSRQAINALQARWAVGLCCAASQLRCRAALH